MQKLPPAILRAILATIQNEKVAIAHESPHSQVLFGICAAVLHKPELVGTPHWNADIWKYAFDTLIQTERQHCDACLRALVSLGLAEQEVRKEKGSCNGSSGGTGINRRVYYTIKDSLLERIFGFSEDVGKQFGAAFPAGYDDRIEFSRKLFDFFQYKYLPEWKLFLYCVDRECNGASPERRKVIDDWLHGHPEAWVLVHKYILWLGEDRSSERSFESLLREIACFFSPDEYDFARAQESLRCLGGKGLGLFMLSGGKLQPNRHMGCKIEEYVNTVTRELSELVSAVTKVEADLEHA